VGSGRLIAKLNELGGLPMAGPLANYTLRVLDNYDRGGGGRKKQKAAAAHPDAIVSQLALQLLHLEVEHEARGVGVGGGGGGGVGGASVIRVDASVRIDLEFSGEVCFELQGQRWFTPDIGNIGVKDLHVRCDLQLWLDMAGGEVRLACSQQPNAGPMQCRPSPSPSP
jgi:hypothetical protein